jgi:hypothetical protein
MYFSSFTLFDVVMGSVCLFCDLGGIDVCSMGNSVGRLTDLDHSCEELCRIEKKTFEMNFV